MKRTKVLGRMLVIFMGEHLEISKRIVNTRNDTRTARYFVRILR